MHKTTGLVAASVGGLTAMLVVAAPAASEKTLTAQPFQTEVSVHVDGDEPDGTSCVALAVPLGRQMLAEHVEVSADVQDDPTVNNRDRVQLRKDVSITTTQDGAQAIHSVPLVERHHRPAHAFHDQHIAPRLDRSHRSLDGGPIERPAPHPIDRRYLDAGIEAQQRRRY